MRRRLLAAGVAACAAPWLATRAGAHNTAGRVEPPLPAPAIPLQLHNGQRSSLPLLLAGRATALQLMFTGCSATCPFQGALFGAAQAGLAPATAGASAGTSGLQLLSVSIDALGDTPAALARWMQGFGAGPHWRAALPSVAGVDQLLDFLRGRQAGPDGHTAQVYYFNRSGQLVLRSADFPPPEQVVSLLKALRSS
jgi:protein SCO1/2